MKNRMITLLISVCIIISGSVLIMLIQNKDENEKFPHFKQAIIKMYGRAYLMQDMKFSLSLVVLDESKISEFSRAENIKSITLLDNNSNEYPCDIKSVNEGLSEKECIIRAVNTELEFTSVGIYTINKAVVTFIDDKSEIYDIGDLEVVVFSQNYLKENIYSGDIQLDLALSNKDNKFEISGIQMIVNSYNNLIKINDIDLGIDGLSFDFDKMYYEECETMEKCLNLLENARQNDKKWADVFDEVRTEEDFISGFKSIEIGDPDKLNTYTAFLIPFVYEGNVDINNTILCFSLFVNVEYKKENKIFFNQDGMIYNPLLNPSFDKMAYLRDEGV